MKDFGTRKALKFQIEKFVINKERKKERTKEKEKVA